MHHSVARATRVLLFVATTLVASTASAEWEVYNQGDTKLVLNADFVGAGFVNLESWFGEGGDLFGDNTDTWGEFGFEPKLTGEMPLGGGTAFGQISGVYTKTWGNDASGLTVGTDKHDLRLEQGHIGWKIDDLFEGLEDDTFSVAIGRQDYNIGTGLLINDGGGDGGARGGWYIGMRKAFQESIIVRVKSKTLLAEGFRVRNRPRRGGTQGQAYGGNLEYTFADQLTLGGTYMGVDADVVGSDVLGVFSGRVSWATPVKGLGLSGEYVIEDSDDIEADGWYAQILYQTEGIPWSPALSYRYASFDGDDPDTAKDERFREIAYGFTDYGSWFQGEITGNYPLANGNLRSHQVRIKAQPLESLSVNFFYYNFTLDEPSGLAPGVTSDHWGDEVNFIADWQATDQLFITGVVGLLMRGRAAEQSTLGDNDWVLFMLYGSYSW